MYARSTTIQAQPTSIDAGITHMRDKVMPALEAIDGCVGLSLLVDRTSGRCIATSSWESEEAMRASAESLRPMRDRAAGLFGVVAPKSRNGRSVPCTASTARVRAPAFGHLGQGRSGSTRRRHRVL